MQLEIWKFEITRKKIGSAVLFFPIYSAMHFSNDMKIPLFLDHCSMLARICFVLRDFGNEHSYVKCTIYIIVCKNFNINLIKIDLYNIAYENAK